MRNVIEHLRRGGAAHKPLVVVVANSGVPEEVRLCAEGGRTCAYGVIPRLGGAGEPNALYLYGPSSALFCRRRYCGVVLKGGCSWLCLKYFKGRHP